MTGFPVYAVGIAAIQPTPMLQQRLNPHSSELRLTLAQHDLAPSSARERLKRYARSAQLDPGELESVRLLVSELVTNAVRHSGACGADQIGVHIQTSPSTIRIEVTDAGSGFEPPRSPRPRRIGGFGLFLVSQLCARWGTEHDGESLVWCELERVAPANSPARPIAS